MTSSTRSLSEGTVIGGFFTEIVIVAEYEGQFYERG